MDTDLGRGPPGSHVDRWAGEQHGGPGFDLLSGGRSSASHTKWELLTPGRWKVREEACEARPGAATKAGHTPHHLLTNEPGRSLPLQLSSRSSRGHPAARLPCPAWYLKATRSSSFPTHQPRLQRNHTNPNVAGTGGTEGLVPAGSRLCPGPADPSLDLLVSQLPGLQAGVLPAPGWPQGCTG